MESLALKHNIIWLAVATVLVAALIVTMRVLEASKHHQGKGAGNLPAAEAVCKPSIVNAETRQTDLQTGLLIVNEIVSAYSNAEDGVMLELVKKIPQGALTLPEEDCLKLRFPVNRAWYRFLSKRKVEDPSLPAADFIRRMKAEIALSKVFGQMIVASGRTAQSVLADIDCGVLERLQTYKEVFAREGRVDCQKATEELVGEWLQQIESTNGFTREYLRSQDRGLRRLVKRGHLTEVELRKNVRGCAFPLSDLCGYTPKWLDEEFPLLPEGATKKETDLPE